MSRKGRARSRKRQASAPRSDGAAATTGSSPRSAAPKPKRAHERSPASCSATGSAWRQAVEGVRATPGPRPRGSLSRERPKAPWHPLPLSEILIAVGAVGVVIGLSSQRKSPLLLGLVAVALGTIEVTWREHMSGFRSHTLLLAFLPIVVFHSLVALLIGAFGHVTPAINIAVLAIDVALFAVLFRLLRVRFKEAQARGGTVTS